MGHKNVRYISSMSNRDQGGGVKKQGLPSTVGKSGLLTMSIRRRASNNFKTTEPVSESISGTINDGPVSGATVKLIDVLTNNKIAETKTNTLGRYNFNVSELPDTFRIETEENTGTDTITRETKIPKLSGIFRKNINDLNNANINIVTTLVSDMVTNENLTIDVATTRVKKLSSDTNLNIYNDFISSQDRSLLLLNQKLFFMYNINKASKTSDLATKLSELIDANNDANIEDLAGNYLTNDEEKNIFNKFNNLTTYPNTTSFITIVEDSYKLTQVSKIELVVQSGETITDVIQKEKFKIKLNRINEASLKELRLTDSTKFTLNGTNYDNSKVYSLSNNALSNNEIILQSEKLVIDTNEVLVIDNSKAIIGRSGYIENNGTIIIRSNGQLAGENTGKFIVNNGTIYLTDNHLNSNINTLHNDTIENNTDGVINIINGAKINFASIEGTIINFGTINNNGSLISKTTIVNKTIVNYGTFNNYENGKLIRGSEVYPLDDSRVFNIDDGKLHNIVLEPYVTNFITDIQYEINNKITVGSSYYDM